MRAEYVRIVGSWLSGRGVYHRTRAYDEGGWVHEPDVGAPSNADQVRAAAPSVRWSRSRSVAPCGAVLLDDVYVTVRRPGTDYDDNVGSIVRRTSIGMDRRLADRIGYRPCRRCYRQETHQ